MHSPRKTEMVQKHVDGELRLHFWALVDRQRHCTVAQAFMGKGGQLGSKNGAAFQRCPAKRNSHQK